MPGHYTKATVEASIFCGKCHRMTSWRIADGRRQYCLVCYQNRLCRESHSSAEDGQLDLFKAPKS